MIDRRARILVLVIAALIVAKVILNLVVDPLGHQRDELNAALAEIPTNAPLANESTEDFARLTQAIHGTPSLWNELVDPPPPPPPVAPPPPTAPDLEKMLGAISVSKGQIGTTKLKIYSAQSPRGSWLQVGEEILGCTLKSFTKEEAVFSYYWKEGKRELQIALPRK